MRPHNSRRDLYGDLLPNAGYAVLREQHVPGWDRRRQRRNGEWVTGRAVLDLRLEAPPDAPITYLDMVVTHPCVAAHLHGAATGNGHAASQAEAGKHARYPANAHVRGRLVPFAVETYGRLGGEGVRPRRWGGQAHARAWEGAMDLVRLLYMCWWNCGYRRLKIENIRRKQDCGCVRTL